VPRAVDYAREVLNDPTITESKFRHWIAGGYVRFRRFGGMYSFVVNELQEDLAGKTS
jgi:hypothetical protein